MVTSKTFRIGFQFIGLLMMTLPLWASGDTRLSVEGNLQGLRENMENTCTAEEAHIVGLSVDTCSKEKDSAIEYCADVVGGGLADSITFEQFEQILVPRLTYCILMRRIGFDAGAEEAEKLRGLISYEKRTIIEAGTSSKSPQPRQ